MASDEEDVLSRWHPQDPQGVSATAAEADESDDEIDVEEAFSGEHAIEYWVRRGNRLVPATPDEIALIRETEALHHLAYRLVERMRHARAPWWARVGTRLVHAWATLLPSLRRQHWRILPSPPPSRTSEE